MVRRATVVGSSSFCGARSALLKASRGGKALRRLVAESREADSQARYRIVYSNLEQAYTAVIGGLTLASVVEIWGTALRVTWATPLML